MWNYGILQISIITLAYWKLGFLYGSGFLFILYHLAENVFKMFGYEPISFVDIGMGFEKGDCTNNVVSYFEVGRVDIDSVKKRIYEKGILKLPQLRYIRNDILGLGLFKVEAANETISPELYFNSPFHKSQIKRVKKEVRDEQGVIDYCSGLAQYKFDMSKPLWECHVQENYTKDTSLLFFVFQHSLLDAVGYCSFISCILDNQFEIKMKKKFPPITWYWRLAYLVFGLIFTTYMSARYKMLKSDEGAAKVAEKIDATTDQKNCYSTVELDFEAVRK